MICRAPATEAHHVTFAEKRGKGQKVGDQWTVPLCWSCHRALHAARNERSWWAIQGVDPLLAAAALAASSPVLKDHAVDNDLPDAC